MAESKDILQIGIETILLESKSLNKLSTLLDVNFSNVVHEILSSKGRVVVTGIGKSAIIGQKIAATFNSTETNILLSTHQKFAALHTSLVYPLEQIFSGPRV